MNNYSHPEHGSSNTSPKDVAQMKTLLSSHLDGQVENLDYNITSRLSAARHRALAGEQRPGRSMGVSRLLLVGGMCTAVLASLLVTQIATDSDISQTPQVTLIDPAVQSGSVQKQTHIVEDLQLLSASDDIEFYESLEFLEWIETNSG